MNKCLLFDCDGTLVDSERLANLALTIKLRELGIELDTDELMRQYRGWKLSRVLDSLCEGRSGGLPDTFIKDYRALVSDLFEQELFPIEGVHEALEKLPYHKAVVSSGPMAKIQQSLRICNLTEHFENRLFSSYDTRYWKPDPKSYIIAADSMGFKAEDCIVVDDGLVGIEAGVKAGMRILFFNRFEESCEYEDVESFTSMDELSGLVCT